MAERLSRTYKMKLSPRGVTLFLECHTRLCLMICDFLAYGTTLQVAVALLERAPVDDMLADISAAEILELGGREIRYVGASHMLMERAVRIARRIEGSGRLSPPPQTWKIYIAALLHLRSSDDAAILRCLETVDGRTRSR